jgi:hypothetical protein
LLAIVDDVKPNIVVLDTVSRFITGKENDSDSWLQLYGRVHAPLKAAGIAGVRLDHMGKDAERGSRGSSAKSQDVDHVWEMVTTDERRTRENGVETIVTQIRLKRTHTRTGLGEDVFEITRRGCRAIGGMWLPELTRHVLAEPGTVREPDAGIQSFVDRLIEAGAPTNLGRPRLRTWAIEHGIPLPAKTATLGEVVAAFKRQSEATS